MATSLASAFIEKVGPSLLERLPGFLGYDAGTAKQALEGGVSSLMGGMARTVAGSDGARKLLDLVSGPEVSAEWASNPAALFSGNQPSPGLLAAGAKLLPGLLGDGAGQAVGALAGQTGLSKSSAEGLMGLLAPMALSFLKNKVSAEGLGADALAGLLGGAGGAGQGLAGALLGAVGPALMERLPAFLGYDAGTARNALEGGATALADGLAAGAAADGGKGLLALITGPQVSGDWATRPSAFFSGNQPAGELLAAGTRLLPTLLGDKLGGVVGALRDKTGLSLNSTEGLLATLAPLALSFLKNRVSAGNLGADGLLGLLGGTPAPAAPAVSQPAAAVAAVGALGAAAAGALAAGAKAVADGAKGAADAAADVGKAAAGKATEGAKAAVEGVGDTAKAAAGAVAAGAAAAAGALGAGAKTAAGAVTEGVKAVGETAAGGAKAVTEGAKAAVEGVGGTAKAAAGAVAAGAAAAVGALGAGAGAAGQGAKATVETVAGGAKAAAGAVGAGAAAATAAAGRGASRAVEQVEKAGGSRTWWIWLLLALFGLLWLVRSCAPKEAPPVIPPKAEAPPAVPAPPPAEPPKAEAPPAPPAAPPVAEPAKPEPVVAVPAAGKSVELAVQFATGSAVIGPMYRKQLDEFAAQLKAHNGKGEVAGHTDNVGNAAGNKALSERRAQAVRQYLVGKGVPAAALTAKGYGAEQPKADNATEEGRAQNRRIEFVAR